jgi:hypothetical protein
MDFRGAIQGFTRGKTRTNLIISYNQRDKAGQPVEFSNFVVRDAAIVPIMRSINYQKQLNGKKHITLFLLWPQP